MVHVHNTAPTYSAASHYCTDYCTALQPSGVPHPLALLRLKELPHVGLLHTGLEKCVLMNDILGLCTGKRRHRYCRTPLLRSPEKRSATRVPRWLEGTAPVPRRIIMAVFDLFRIHLVDVTAFQCSRHHVCRIVLHSLNGIRIVCSRLCVPRWPHPNSYRV